MILDFILTALLAANAAASPPPPNLKVFIAAGQSNEEGRAPVATMPDWGNKARLWMLDKRGSWVQAKHPTHPRSKAAGGPALYTAERLAETFTSNNIGIIPCAVGGTGIKFWVPKGKYFEACIKMAAGYDVIGVIYYQGEEDSRSEKLRNAWPANLVKSVEGFRTSLNKPNLPFIYTLLGPTQKNTANYAIMRIVQANALGSLRQPAAYIDALADGTTIDKGNHIDGRSSRIVGRKQAEALLKFLP